VGLYKIPHNDADILVQHRHLAFSESIRQNFSAPLQNLVADRDAERDQIPV
jgi:hypothetical protein